MSRIIIFLSISLLIGHSHGQVRDIKERSSANKQSSSSSDSRSSNNSSSSSSGSDSFSGGLMEALLTDIVFGIIKIPFQVTFHAHREQVAKMTSDKWRAGFEAQFKAGLDFKENTTFINPMIRGNYGLFSTQIRYNRISDESGGFGTLDWQILQLNLLNNEYARFTAGIGVSSEMDQNQSYAEKLLELSLFFNQRSIVPTFVYRYSGDGYPRKEFSSHLNYRPHSLQKKSMQFSLGYTHQRWYDIPINYVSAGIGLIIE